MNSSAPPGWTKTEYRRRALGSLLPRPRPLPASQSQNGRRPCGHTLAPNVAALPPEEGASTVTPICRARSRGGQSTTLNALVRRRAASLWRHKSTESWGGGDLHGLPENCHKLLRAEDTPLSSRQLRSATWAGRASSSSPPSRFGSKEAGKYPKASWGASRP